MPNMDEKQQGSFPKGSAGGLEEEAEHDKTSRWILACNKGKKAKIRMVISQLIFGGVFFLLGTLVPSNHQKDAIKCPPVGCPLDWIGHQGHCYKLSGEEKNWMESQNFCILHNASLAKITGKEEMAFLRMFTRNHVVWIGLRRELNHPWKWLDGENATTRLPHETGRTQLSGIKTIKGSSRQINQTEIFASSL